MSQDQNTPPDINQMYQVALVQSLDITLQMQALARAAITDVIDHDASEEQRTVVLRSLPAGSASHEVLASVLAAYCDSADALNAIRMPAPNIHLSRPSTPPQVKIPNGLPFDGPLGPSKSN